MRPLFISLGLILLNLPALHGQTITPTPVAEGDLADAPFSYCGRLTTGTTTGSAAVVARGVIATSAGLIYDETIFTWVPIGNILYEPRYHKGGAAGISPVAFQKWDSYAARVQGDDESPPGLELPDTHNVNFAAGYFAASNNALIEQHPEVHVDPTGSTSILRDNKDKTTVGYPTESPFIPGTDAGLMHSTLPENLSSPWEGLEGLDEVDSDGFWLTVHTLIGVDILDGAQGGPVYVRDDFDNWLMGGIVVGKSPSDEMIVKAIDEKTWTLVEEAIAARQVETLQRVTDLSVVRNERTFVELAWNDLSEGEAGYKVYRQDTGPWLEIATLPADSSGYTDEGLLTGQVYGYRVQPYATDGNRPPKSYPVRASTRGSDPAAAAFLNQPWLRLSNSGESNWSTDAFNRLRSGDTISNGQSTFRLDIIGPGTVDFEWGISSVVDPNFLGGRNPSSLQLSLNGNAVEAGLILGQVGQEARQLILPPGPHRIEWTYTKGPYTVPGVDAGFLYSLEWTPDAVDPYPVYGGYAFPEPLYHGSEWFGAYYVAFWPWVANLDLGWMYLFSGSPSGQLYFYSVLEHLGSTFTSPDLYPYLYSADSATWFYYLPGTANFGSGGWFFDYSIGVDGDWIQTP